MNHYELVKRALRAGIRNIQLREKEMSKRELFYEAVRIREITEKYRALFIVNDYVDIALAAHADGVHLGQEDMPPKDARKVLGRDKIIGVSTHNIREVKRAIRDGADYIGFGPIFSTDTKDAGRPKGISGLKKIRPLVPVPIAAIGGITHTNAKEVFEAGADVVAVISGILKGDIELNIERFIHSI
jgi:thiamine-phosphate pyrophosphorylase